MWEHQAGTVTVTGIKRKKRRGEPDCKIEQWLINLFLEHKVEARAKKRYGYFLIYTFKVCSLMVWIVVERPGY